MDSIEEILCQDEVKGLIDEICKDIEDFSKVDFIHIQWAKKDEKVQGGYYGTLDTILANLEKAKFLLMCKEAGGGEDKG